jgi:hypothetical protein
VSSRCNRILWTSATSRTTQQHVVAIKVSVTVTIDPTLTTAEQHIDSIKVAVAVTIDPTISAAREKDVITVHATIPKDVDSASDS